MLLVESHDFFCKFSDKRFLFGPMPCEYLLHAVKYINNHIKRCLGVYCDELYMH